MSLIGSGVIKIQNHVGSPLEGSASMMDQSLSALVAQIGGTRWENGSAISTPGNLDSSNFAAGIGLENGQKSEPRSIATLSLQGDDCAITPVAEGGWLAAILETWRGVGQHRPIGRLVVPFDCELRSIVFNVLDLGPDGETVSYDLVASVDGNPIGSGSFWVGTATDGVRASKRAAANSRLSAGDVVLVTVQNVVLSGASTGTPHVVRPSISLVVASEHV